MEDLMKIVHRGVHSPPGLTSCVWVPKALVLATQAGGRVGDKCRLCGGALHFM